MHALFWGFHESNSCFHFSGATVLAGLVLPPFKPDKISNDKVTLLFQCKYKMSLLITHDLSFFMYLRHVVFIPVKTVPPYNITLTWRNTTIIFILQRWNCNRQAK